MELVFENGQILAKSFSLQNQRRETIMDLYEAEYNEDFNKSIQGDTSDVSIKNLVDTTQTLKASSSKRMVEFIPPDEQSVVAERSVELGFDSTTGFTEDSDGSTYLSSSLHGDDVRPRVSATLVKRSRSKEIYNSPERVSNLNNDINKKMRTLQDLLPNSQKDDNEALLDEANNYMTTFQHQVQMMMMGNRFVTPAMMLPLGMHYSQMGLATGMQMGVPQFLPAPVLNHPGLVPMQNSALFPQSVRPSCGGFPNQIPNSTSLLNLDDARTDGGNLSGKKSLINREQMK